MNRYANADDRNGRVFAPGVLAFFLIAGAFLPQTANAQPEENTELAQAHFRIGSEAYANGRFQEAYDAFLQSFEASGRPELLFNMAQCKDRLAQWQESETLYTRYLEELPDADNIAFVQARISFAHEQTASSAEPDSTDGANDSDGSDGSESSDDSGSTNGDDAASSPSLVLPVTLLVVGGLALGTSAVLGIMTSAKYSELQTNCPDGVCDPSREADADTMQTMGLTADILLGVGVAAAATGLILLLVSGPDDDAETAELRLGCGLGGCTLNGRF